MYNVLGLYPYVNISIYRGGIPWVWYITIVMNENAVQYIDKRYWRLYMPWCKERLKKRCKCESMQIISFGIVIWLQIWLSIEIKELNMTKTSCKILLPKSNNYARNGWNQPFIHNQYSNMDKTGKTVFPEWYKRA
jgi:hypothetical protein